MWNFYSCLCTVQQHWRIYTVKFWMRPPPHGGPNSFNFMQFLGKFGKIIYRHPPGELVPPPRGNPGSATATVFEELPLWFYIVLVDILRRDSGCSCNLSTWKLWIHKCQSWFVGRRSGYEEWFYYNCLPGENLHTLEQDDTYEYNNCREWCNNNEYCEGFVVANDTCYFKGYSCRDERFEDFAADTDLILKRCKSFEWLL